MSDSERDDELENFLRRRSPMHRRLADIDNAEPSIELDRLVLNRAREAIETPAQPPMFRASRWAMPAGLAATILIAFTLVLNVEHQPKQGASEELAAASVPAQASGAMADHAGSAGSAAESLAKASPSEPPRALTRQAEPAPAAPSLAAASNAAGTPRAADSKAEVAGSPATTAAAAPAAATASASIEAANSGAHSDAESWLREISRLRTEGKNADADRELAAFRRAYPSHSGTSLAQPPTR